MEGDADQVVPKRADETTIEAQLEAKEEFARGIVFRFTETEGDESDGDCSREGDKKGGVFHRKEAREMKEEGRHRGERTHPDKKERAQRNFGGRCAGVVGRGHDGGFVLSMVGLPLIEVKT